MGDKTCPVCTTELLKKETRDDRHFFDCPRCGPYSLTGSTAAIIRGKLSATQDGSAKLSYILRRMTTREQWAMLDSYQLDNILQQTKLPTPQEQLELLVQWLGEHLPGPGDSIDATDALISEIGARDNRGLAFVVEHAKEAGLAQGTITRFMSGDAAISSISLSFQGWSFFESIKRGNSMSRTAFMAMQFGDDLLDSFYSTHLKEAVKATGFELKRLDEGQPAGLIDDRLRVEIRQARFLVADLTHHNRGAYWEAGYAEGLGKPVIYTCRKEAFDNTGTHFDTNHHLTVIWDSKNPSEAIEKLKATIRATLPTEAKLTD